MAAEKNNEIIEEEARVTEEVQEQPEGLPVDVTVEGEEKLRRDLKMILMQTLQKIWMKEHFNPWQVI